MIKAKIKKHTVSPYEVSVYCNGVIIAAIRCIDYGFFNNDLIICKHFGYNSYVHCDDYTCETWKD